MEVRCLTIDLSHAGVTDVRPITLQKGSVIAVQVDQNAGPAALDSLARHIGDIVDRFGLKGEVMFLVHTTEVDVRIFNEDEMRRFGYVRVR